MKTKKVWFIGYTSRLWVPISIEGTFITILFFIGIIVIGAINQDTSTNSLTFSQIILLLLEFGTLVTVLYFITKGHVDKRY